MAKKKTNGSQPRVGVASATTTSVVKSQPGQGQSKGARRRRRLREGGGGGGVDMGAYGSIGAQVRGATFRGTVSGGGPRQAVLQHVVSAPAIESYVVPSSGFSLVGKAQSLVDYDSTHSCRVCGNGLYTNSIITNASTGTGIIGGNYSGLITPSVLDTRLGNIEAVFQFYAIRKVRFTFITQLPSSGSVTTGTGALAFGVASDSLISFTPSLQTILELYPSVMTPCWQSCSFEYTHTGTKTWECFTSGSSNALQKVQALLYGQSPGAGGQFSVLLGYMYVDYIVDFYEPGPVLGTINLMSLTDRYEAFQRDLAEHRNRKASLQLELQTPDHTPIPPLPSSAEALSTVVLSHDGRIPNTTETQYVVIPPGSTIGPTANAGVSSWLLRR